MFSNKTADGCQNRRVEGIRTWLAIAILVMGLIVNGLAHAQAREQSSLGDLQIPASRVPAWQSLDHLPVDTSSWAVHNVPCGSHTIIEQAIATVVPNTIVQLPANCVYLFPASSFELTIDRSGIVLRGAPDLSSVLEFQSNDRGAVVLGIWRFGSRRNDMFGDSRGWTGGFRMGDQILSVANTSGLEVGGWVRLRANPEPDWHDSAINGYAAKLECVGNVGTHPSCSTLSSNQVRLDRPLHSEYTQGGNTLERVTGELVSNSGIERVRVRHQTPSQIEKYRPRVTIQDCYECWITDSVFGDAGNAHIVMQKSARLLVRGNGFGSNQCTYNGSECSWNKGAIYFNQEAYDGVFENNYIVNTPSGPLLETGGGNVVAFNYLTADPSVRCERHIFLHGRAVRASLIEGNDVSCMIQWDGLRGGQGYYNMFYRNRVRMSPSNGQTAGAGFHRGRLGSEETGQAYIHRSIAVIGNHVNELRGAPWPDRMGLDRTVSPTHQHRDTWLSYNVTRFENEFDSNAVRTTLIENHTEANGPPSAWSTIDFPASLYRSEPPSWWCEESGPFPNIGAPSDTMGSYARLPAQIRLEGGVCTPPGGFPAPNFLAND